MIKRYEAAVSVSDKGMIMNAIYLPPVHWYGTSLSTQHWHSEVNRSPAALATHVAADPSNLVAEMKGDSNEEWINRAHKLNRTQKVNRDEVVLPSKWRLVQYALSRP